MHFYRTRSCVFTECILADFHTMLALFHCYTCCCFISSPYCNMWVNSVLCGLGWTPVGYRRLCADGEEDGSDSAGIRDRAGWDRAAQWCRGHVHPAERSHGKEREDEGEEEEVQHHIIVQDWTKLLALCFSSELD